MKYLIDTNVILDIFTQDRHWFSWSNATLDACCDGVNYVAINAVIYSELSIGFTSMVELDDALEVFHFQFDDMPKEALFVAGKAFLHYKQLKGSKGSVLPDFYIGALAIIGNYTLVTRDSARYRTYFPTIQLLCPV